MDLNQSLAALQQNDTRAEAIMHTLLYSTYPHLFTELNKIGFLIQELRPEHDISLLMSFHVKMMEELDEIYRKEKLVLFPYLSQLLDSAQASASCSAFTNVKRHFASLLAVTGELYQHLTRLANTEPVFEPVMLPVKAIKQTLIQLQAAKERQLFARFIKCDGACKTI